MGFLTPPKTEYNNYYDQSRFNFVWRAAILFLALMSFVTVSNITNPNYSGVPNIIGMAMVVLVIFTLYKTRKFELTSKIFAICATVLISSIFFLLTDVIHYTTPMWMITNILFTFFTLGIRWGMSVLTVHFTVIIFYFFFQLESNIENLPDFSNQDIFNFATEYIICGLGIASILYLFVRTNNFAEGKFKLSNKILNKQNQLISVQNQEKEIMVKEIHHRVKNNLQVITSMLRLQSNELDNQEVSTEFNAAIHRINAMALIHEKMYHSNMLADFDLKNYLDSLAIDLIQSYSLDKKVDLQITSNVIKVSSKNIVPLAIIFNELISNSLKHAFEKQSKPLITVDFSTLANNQFKLIYDDNGKWKTNDKSTFGSELIATMTEQLDGSIELSHSSQGTTYSFIFKNQEEDSQEKI